MRRGARWAAGGAGAAGVALVVAALLATTSASSGTVGAVLAVGLLAAAVGLRTAAGRLRGGGPEAGERDLPGFLGYPCACADPAKRRLLGRLAIGSGVVAAAAALPALWSLSRRVEQELRQTAWTPGARAVDALGQPVRVDDLELGSFTTVWPEGRTDAGDAQAVLIRLREGRAMAGAGRTDWVAEGHVAFSKLCTHMGCPVGLYQTESDVLVCPCHQAMFDVLRGCEPIHGPARRPLPQLPLAVDGDGYVIATGDFPEPVGPGFWRRPR